MRPRDLGELLVLAALWGGSFLFMRLGAFEFGPLPLVFVRVAGASALLLPLLLWRGQGAALRRHWRPIVVVGVLNTALPFALMTMAALVLTAGLMSVVNATAPIWAALVAWLWLHERPARWRMLGLATGVAGVVGLAWGQADFRADPHGVSPALALGACVLGTLAYGIASNISRQHLQGVPPMAVAAGSQLSATTVLVLPAAWAWPAVNPGATAWASAAALAVACTAVAYVIFFRLIARTGAANAMAVTFLIPAFGIAWGWLFLHEAPTLQMLLGCGVILLGTALATGLLPRQRPPVAGTQQKAA